jgi:GntR family transcriptional regulator
LKHDIGLAFEDEMRVAGRKVSFRVLSRLTISPPVIVRERLALRANDVVDVVERLRLLDGEPIALERRFFPPQVGRLVDEKRLAREAIISLLSSVLRRPPARIANTVRSVAADRRTARYLAVPIGAPLLETEHTYFDEDGRPVLHGLVRFHGERFEFVLKSLIHVES